MAQHDYNIANDSGANVRADINNVLTAIKTLNSGSSTPSSTAPGMSWLDTSDSNTWYWKLRNNADDAWIFVGALDVATDVFQPMIGADELETYLSNNFYTETEADALLDDKVSNTGNETISGIKTFSSFPITPSSAPTTDYQVANKKYVDGNSGISLATANGFDLGVGQTWQDVTASRSNNVTYTNTTGRPILVSIIVTGSPSTDIRVVLEVDGSEVSSSTGGDAGSLTRRATVTAVIPNGSTYRIGNILITAGTIIWNELR